MEKTANGKAGEELNMADIVSQWYEEKKHVDEMLEWNPTLKEWEQSVIRFFPEGAKILDIGCGLGREAFVLSDMGFDVTGVDISGEVIAKVTQLAAARGYTVPFIEYDGKKLPFPDESFDVVLVWAQTFGLLYGEDYKLECMAEWKRVLKKGGLVSFSAHDYRYLEEHHPDCLQGRKFYPYANAHIYWEAFEAPELIGFADRAGLEVILYEKGRIYKPEDGTVLHCLCRK